MFTNYLKIAYRNLLSKKGFSIINIVGLSIGMTCCLLIFQYVAFEYSFDRFHQHKDQLYRVLQAYAPQGDAMDLGHAFTAQALTPALKESVPEILDIARVHPEDAVLANPARPENVFEDAGVLYVDPAFTTMFSFPLATGNATNELESGEALITEASAQKYFGTTNAEGQLLEIAGMVNETYTIVGVLKDLPANSHLQFAVLLPIDDLLRGENYSNEPEGGWSWNNFTTYIRLTPNANRSVVEKKMTSVFLAHRGDVLRQQGWSAAILTQPIADIHLNSEVTGAGNPVMGSHRTVYFFLVIGLITLIIALVNYVNLATARAVNRSREVGVRKVAGARQSQLIFQFLSESALTNLTAALLALVFSTMLVPVVNDVAGTRLTSALWLNPGFWLAFSLTILAGTLLAGLYPAFVLSSFKPASALKGRTAYVASHLWLRRTLVVIQFGASIVLLTGTATVYSQLDFMRHMDLGLDLQKVITVRAPRVLPENIDEAAIMQTFLEQVRNIPGIQNAALSSTIPGSGFNWNGAAIRKAADDPSNAIRGVATYIDSSFALLYGLKLVAGKEFSDITISDAEGTPWTVIINETAVKSLGYSSASEAVGEDLDIGGNAANIIGVYKDFQWSSAHQAQKSIVFGPTTTGRFVSFRVATPDLSGITQEIQEIYNTLFPGNVFGYAFADESFDQQYKNDQRFAKLFSMAAGMTIFIACLGLFGLVAFTAQQRTKEIGMRKVLGATVSNIVSLLSKDFLKLVLFGFILAIPVTWYVMNQWLENFAYRTSISAWVYIISGVAAMLVAILTVSWQSFKAATANPVQSLRNE